MNTFNNLSKLLFSQFGELEAEQWFFITTLLPLFVAILFTKQWQTRIFTAIGAILQL